MPWDDIRVSNIKDLAKLRSWPNPITALLDLEVMMCNRDVWIADIVYAGAEIANFFWTNFIPGPRELERKALAGSYKCGFYMDTKFRSPLEKVWGRGVQRALVEIANPFVTGLFYIWAAGSLIDAIGIWQTIMWPQAFCNKFVGNYLYSGAHAFASSGHSEGGVGLGHLDYDPHGYGNPFVADMNVPPGWTRMNVYWTVDAAGPGFSNFKTGFQIDSTYLEIEDHGAILPGTTFQVSRDFTYEDDFSGHDIAPWWSGDVPLGAGLNVVSAVRVIGDHQIIKPDDPIPSSLREYGQHLPKPKCESQYYNGD